MPAPLITLLTDFGTRDAYVGTMKGVILGICPSARLVDLTHEVPRQGILAGALLLRHAVDYFCGTPIHLAIVDPGVGSARAPILVVTDRGVLVGPDNGLLVPSAESLGLREARRLEASRYFRGDVSRTFHGRDIFAPVAAHLAAGVPPEMFGPPLAQLHPLAIPTPRQETDRIMGEVIHVDHFGNLMTNIPAGAVAALDGPAVAELAGGRIMPLARAYADVPVGEPLALVNSWGRIEIAVRDGNAAQVFAAGSGTVVSVRITVGSRQ